MKYSFGYRLLKLIHSVAPSHSRPSSAHQNLSSRFNFCVLVFISMLSKYR